MERFIDGQPDMEARRHLVVSFRDPQNLEDLVGAVITYEATLNLQRAQKPEDGLYDVRERDDHMSYEQLASIARKMGCGLRPWIERRPGPPQEQRARGGAYAGGNGPQRAGPQQRTSPQRYGGPRKDYSQMKCWNCGMIGHTQHVCKEVKSGLRFAPTDMRVNVVNEQSYNESYDEPRPDYDAQEREEQSNERNLN